MPEYRIKATWVVDSYGPYGVWCGDGAWWIQDLIEEEEGETFHFTQEIEADTEEDALELFALYYPCGDLGGEEWTTIEIKEIEEGKEFLRSN